MGWVMMSERDFHRIEVLAQVDDGRLSVQNGPNLLGVTRRQMFRFLKTYRTEGGTGIRYKARGKAPNNQIHDVKRDYAVALVKEKYEDFGPTLAAEMLRNTTGSRSRVRHCANGCRTQVCGCPANSAARFISPDHAVNVLVS